MTQNEFQLLLQNNFVNNLKLLKLVDKELYDRVDSLSQVINSRLYKERYFLELTKEDEFDIFDSHTDTYLYSKEFKKWNQNFESNVNFDLNSFFGLFNPYYYNQNLFDLSDEKLDLLTLSVNKLVTDIQNYKTLLNQNIKQADMKIKRVNKFIFIGTLLGSHINPIIEKTNPSEVLICENNLEIFRLSLFITDYTSLFSEKTKIFFSIMEDETLFFKKFEKFFQLSMMENNIIKYSTTDYNVGKYFDWILNGIFHFDPYKFNYWLILDNLIKRTVLNRSKNLLKLNKNINNLEKKKPVILLGAGPSLGKNINWLKENADRFIIVAVGGTLSKLSKHEIKPDIVVSYDPQDFVYVSFQKNSKLIEKSIKLIAANSDDNLLKLFENDQKFFTFECYKNLQYESDAVIGFSVGEASLMILLLLGFENLYMLGIDLSIDSKTGLTHDDMHISNDNMVHDINSSSSIEKSEYSLRDDLFKIKGNFDKEVYTTRLFYLSLIQANDIVRLFKKENQQIFNLSNGAFIEGTIPLSIGNIDTNKLNLIEKNKLSESLIKVLNENLGEHYSTGQKKYINAEINRIKKMKSEIKKTKNIKEFESFESKISDIFGKLRNNNSIYLLELFINFNFIITRYISFSFYNKDIQDEKEKLEKVIYMWSFQLNKILDDYKKYLETFIK